MKNKFIKYLMLTISFSVLAPHQEINLTAVPYSSGESSGFFKYVQMNRGFLGESCNPTFEEVGSYFRRYRGFEDYNISELKLQSLLGQFVPSQESTKAEELERNFLGHIISGKTVQEHDEYVLSILNQYRNISRSFCSERRWRARDIKAIEHDLKLTNAEDLLDLIIIIENLEIVRFAMTQERIESLSKLVPRFCEIINNLECFERVFFNYGLFLEDQKIAQEKKEQEEKEKNAKIAAQANGVFRYDPSFLRELESDLKSYKGSQAKSSEDESSLPLISVQTPTPVSTSISIAEDNPIAAAKPKANEFGGLKKGFFKGF
jgi:hypothetical protein